MVRQSASLRDVSEAQGVFALRTKISMALGPNLLNDDNVADVARRLDVGIGQLQGWAPVGNPVDRNNRFEIDLRRSFRMANGAVHDGFSTKVVNCSKRHLKDEYYLAFNEDAYDSAQLNTIAYCSSASFHAGLRYFAERIAASLNTWEAQRVSDPYGRGRTAPRYDAMPPYAPRAGEPEFRSDSGAGNNIHCFCVTTPNVAVTLDLHTHAQLKVVLRGVYSQGAAQRPARTAWANIRNMAQIQEIIPAYERESVERAIA